MLKNITQSRAHDYAYDSTYSVSHARDLYRDVQRMNPPKLERLPNFSNMFSENPIHPSHMYRFKSTPAGPTPQSILAQATADLGGGGGLGAGASFPSQTYVPGGRGLNSSVAGPERWRYFKRPVVPFLKAVPPDMVSVAPAFGEVPPIPEPRCKSASIQTDYRESEAQTDPYTPDYYVPEGSNPEILTLASLKYGNGLPASLTEVEMIERARRRRRIEASLPPITDEASLQARMKILSDLENLEWAEREAQIDKAQEERLRVMSAALERREGEREEASAQRVDMVREVKSIEADIKLDTIDHARTKEMRKLVKARGTLPPAGNVASLASRSNRDIILEYADFGSRVYAPLKREGSDPEKTSKHPDIKPLYLESAAGILSLEQPVYNIAAKQRSRSPHRPFSTGKPLTAAERKAKTIQDDVLFVTQTMERNKTRREDPRVSVQDLYKATPRVVRPPTPTIVQAEDPRILEEDNAIRFLQSLIRGRAAQNVYFEGRDRCRSLIEELRASSDAVASSRAAVQQKEQQAREQAAVDAFDNVLATLLTGMLQQLVAEGLPEQAPVDPPLMYVASRPATSAASADAAIADSFEQEIQQQNQRPVVESEGVQAEVGPEVEAALSAAGDRPLSVGSQQLVNDYVADAIAAAKAAGDRPLSVGSQALVNNFVSESIAAADESVSDDQIEAENSAPNNQSEESS